MNLYKNFILSASRLSGLVTHMDNYGDMNVYRLHNVENLISSVK